MASNPPGAPVAAGGAAGRGRGRILRILWILLAIIALSILTGLTWARVIGPRLAAGFDNRVVRNPTVQRLLDDQASTSANLDWLVGQVRQASGDLDNLEGYVEDVDASTSMAIASNSADIAALKTVQDECCGVKKTAAAAIASPSAIVAPTPPKRPSPVAVATKPHTHRKPISRPRHTHPTTPRAPQQEECCDQLQCVGVSFENDSHTPTSH